MIEIDTAKIYEIQKKLKDLKEYLLEISDLRSRYIQISEEINIRYDQRSFDQALSNAEYELKDLRIELSEARGD
jgi:hypothetical protein